MPDIKPRTYHQKGRFISRKIAVDSKVNSLDDSTFLLYLMLIPHLDAEGRMQGDPVMVMGWCCPRRGWSVEKIEGMLVTIQGVKRSDGLGMIERYVADSTHCLWMPGFEGEQKGLQKDREAKGKYGHSDIPPPPKKLLKMAGIKSSIEDKSFLDELKAEYNHLDVDKEWVKCQLYYEGINKVIKNPKLALRNWLDKAKGSKRQSPVRPSGNQQGMQEME